MTEIHTARVGDKLFVINGRDDLAYVDPTKVQKGNKLSAIKRYPKLRILLKSLLTNKK